VNLVGKIFIVVITLLSVLLMAFAMALYATHKDWRGAVINDQATSDKPLGLFKQWEAVKKKNADLTDEKEKLKQQFDAERAAKIQAVAKLENELDVLRKEVGQLEAKQADLEKQKRDAVAALNSTQNSTAALRDELAGERTAVDDTRKDREANFKEVVRLTEELNQAANQKDLLKKRTDELTKDLAKAKQMKD
jgi:chromosome segregation ATPase